jgi:hypothetical protein
MQKVMNRYNLSLKFVHPADRNNYNLFGDLPIILLLNENTVNNVDKSQIC